MISFELQPKDAEMQIYDQITRNRYSLSLSDHTTPQSISVGKFLFPVDAAVSIYTSSITIPSLPTIIVRDKEGKMITGIHQFCQKTLSSSCYYLELCTPIKIYIHVESSISLSADSDCNSHIEFGEPTEVLIGARSKHEQPAGTIVVPDDPEAMFAAISTFGSALKTTSSERSYPTLRGHPPLIERGDRLEIPDELTSPDTGVRLELPATYRHAYVAAPLAYYLGANLVATDSLDDEPRLVTEMGFEHSLSGPHGFERECERVLKQVFFLDCLTRTEGIYDIDLYELQLLSNILDLEFEDLYHLPLQKHIEAYLVISFDTIQNLLPEWRLTSTLEPTALVGQMIPFLAKDLAVVRTIHRPNRDSPPSKIPAINEFMRNSLVRCIDSVPFDQLNTVQLEQTDSTEHVWVGKGISFEASKGLPEANLNRLKRSPSVGPIGITVVCNDTEMTEESKIVESVYGSRENLRFEIDVHRNLTIHELESLLKTQTDFLHYIGHIDADGFQCVDGTLDAATLNTVSIDTFFLNACESFDQGVSLIKSGAIAGITTIYSVVNSGAVRMGATIARLLNCGFPFRTALEIAKKESTVGYHYLVLGDGGLSIAQSESGIPYLCKIEPSEGEILLTLNTYATTDDGMGNVTTPHIEGINKHYLTPGSTPTFSVNRRQLEKFLKLEEVPIKLHGSLHWSSELDLDALERTPALESHQKHK